MAQPQNGIAQGGGKPIPGTDTTGSLTKLPYGPGAGGGGSPINPKVWGVCGLRGLSGIFDNSTVARIVVESGYYQVQRIWSSRHDTQPAYWPVVQWTCKPLTAFTKAKSGWSVFDAPVVTASGGGVPMSPTPIPGSGSQYACVCAGVEGGFRKHRTRTRKILCTRRSMRRYQPLWHLRSPPRLRRSGPMPGAADLRPPPGRGNIKPR
jgi:hypothetical protein